MLPVRLWTYCGMFHAKDGRLTGYTSQEIEALIQWWGKPGEMLPALQKVGYVRLEGEVWCMTDWLEHQGHIEALKVRNRANAKSRWDKYRQEQEDMESGNATGSAKPMRSQCSSPPPSPPDHPTLEVGGGVLGEGVEGGTSKGGAGAGVPGSGRFALPKVGGLPVPLFPATAGKMKAQCDEEIKRIREAARKTAKIETVGTERVRTGTVYEPEAQAAIDAWKRRKEEIERGIA